MYRFSVMNIIKTHFKDFSDKKSIIQYLVYPLFFAICMCLYIMFSIANINNNIICYNILIQSSFIVSLSVIMVLVLKIKYSEITKIFENNYNYIFANIMFNMVLCCIIILLSVYYMIIVDYYLQIITMFFITYLIVLSIETFLLIFNKLFDMLIQ